MKLFVVIDKQCGAGNPLPIHFPPSGLCPARVGHRQVQAAQVQVVPIGSCANVPQWIGVVVDGHFGLSVRARGEVHEQVV